MKGQMLNQFKVGQQVIYSNGISSCNPNISGRIVKLHKSGSHGSAEIKPSSGEAKITRRLQHVRSA